MTMVKNRILSSLIIVFLALAASVYLLWPHFDTFQKNLLEFALNKSSAEYFNHSIRLKRVHVDRELKIHISRFYGELTSEGGPMPLEILELHSLDPLWYFAAGKPVKFLFETARPAFSTEEGLHGSLIVKAGKDGFMEMNGDIKTLALSDLEKLSPENLSGSTGQLKGKIYFRTEQEKADFSIELKIKEPGGLIQARFFDAALPYLPQIPNRSKLEKLAAESRLVPYKDADFTMKLIDPSRMKVFFHILVPSYNLNLNLNVEIRVDKENAFIQIAQMFGLIKIAAQTPAERSSKS